MVAIRKQCGVVELRIDSIEADVAGWGRLLVDRDVDRAVVRGVDMSLSARGLAAVMRKGREPLEIGELVLEDVSVAVMPTALLPGSGASRRGVARGGAPALSPAVCRGSTSWSSSTPLSAPAAWR